MRLIPGLSPEHLISEAKERWQPIKTFCLFSGGNDSGVLAHRCREHYDALFYIDTGIALPTMTAGRDGDVFLGTEDFARQYAEWVGKPLVIRRSSDAYETMVLGSERWWERYRAEGSGLSHEQFQARDEATYGQKEGRVRATGFDLGLYPWGFPGIGGHPKARGRLKERRVEELLAQTKEGHPRSSAVLFLSGIRRAESKNRSAYEPLSERRSAKFVNPLIDWTNAEMLRYRAEHGVPESDVANLLHRSGECNCAAKGSWWKERDLIRAFWPEWFAGKIESLEEEAKARGIRWCIWGGFDLEGNRAGDGNEERPGQPDPICAECEPSFDLGVAA
jgi:3'-phosphoadenosine 5'-phosphosulfate sulfotransferase (PAPS reductase)/FAD synthetase